MKFLFWLIVGLFIGWAWKRASFQRQQSAPPPAQTRDKTQEMVACTHCGLHLPKADAVLGTDGAYCCTAHRSAAGDRHPD